MLLFTENSRRRTRPGTRMGMMRHGSRVDGQDLPDPFGVTVVLMEEDGYSVRLTEAFAR